MLWINLWKTEVDENNQMTKITSKLVKNKKKTGSLKKTYPQVYKKVWICLKIMGGNT